MKVNERLVNKLASVVCRGVERDEGVDVDGADGQTVGGVIIGVDRAATADGVLGVAAVAWPGLGEAEGHTHGGLEGVVGELDAEEFTNVADESLQRGRVCVCVHGGIGRVRLTYVHSAGDCLSHGRDLIGHGGAGRRKIESGLFRL